MRGILLFLIAVVVSGCESTPLIPQMSGGSKSDGVINLSYDKGIYDFRTVDWASAHQNAQSRCRAWGYGGASSFGGTTQECIKMSTPICYQYNTLGQCINKGAANCNIYRVSVKYQCID